MSIDCGTVKLAEELLLDEKYGYNTCSDDVSLLLNNNITVIWANKYCPETDTSCLKTYSKDCEEVTIYNCEIVITELNINNCNEFPIIEEL